MEHFCLRFERYAGDSNRASYRILSFDFNDGDAWEEIARLHVRLPERGYAFEPLARWEQERILFPTFYLLSSQEQDRQFREIYGPLAMGLGAYALRVHDFAIHCIERGTLPLVHPALPAEQERTRELAFVPDLPTMRMARAPRRRAAAMDMARVGARLSVPLRVPSLPAKAVAVRPRKAPPGTAALEPEPRALDRGAALAKLQATHAQRLVQLCAPAGFGKTTLMYQYAAWLRSQGVATRWLSLTEADNDLHRLQDLLETAVAGSQRDARALDAPTHGPGGAVHPTLFIDQVDSLETIALAELCAFVEKVRGMPLRFVMAARARFVLDYLPCDRWSRPVDIDATDLVFSETETRAVVLQMFDTPPDGALACALHAHTQGWPALVRLLCRQLREAPAVAEGDALEVLHRPSPLLSNYLMAEVVERVPEALWPLLRDLCVVDPIEASLGERLLGRGDVAAGLQALFDAGVPMRRLASGGYALHPLLLAPLRRMAARHDAERYVALGEQAAQWLVADGRVPAAVDALVASGQHGAAVRLIESHAQALASEATAAQWTHWCRQIPLAQLKASAVLCTTHATLLAACRGRALAAQWLEDCAQAARAPGADPLWAHTAQWLRLQDLVARGTPAQVQRALPQLKAAVLDAGRGERHRLASLLAEALLATGDYAGAECNIQIAKRIAREERCVAGMAHAHFLEGVSAATRGRMSEAEVALKTAQLLVQDADQDALRTHAVYAKVSGFFAAMHYERNQWADASAWCAVFERHGAMSPQAADSGLQATLVAARVAALQRRPRQAIALLETRLRQARAAEFPRVAGILEQELARQAEALEAAQSPRPAPAGAPAEMSADVSEAAPADSQQATWPASATAAMPPWPTVEPEPARDICLHPGDEIHGGGVARVRTLMASGKLPEAVGQLRGLLATAQQYQRRWREAKLRALLCVAYARAGQAQAAAQECEAVLALGASMGLMRSLLDERDFIEQVRARQAGLRRSALKEPVSAYAAALLVAADNETLLCVPNGTVNFSEQESRVLDLVASGQPNKQVALHLALSVNTVKWHLARIYVKLGANSRDQAVLLARKRGFIL